MTIAERVREMFRDFMEKHERRGPGIHLPAGALNPPSMADIRADLADD